MTPANPILNDDVMCAACAHDDVKRETCAECLGHGVEIITQCPLKVVSDETWLLIELCANAADGMWPVGGGMLDQSYSFVEAHRHYTARTKHYESKWQTK